MSVNFGAILDHELSWEELYRLPTTLNARWSPPRTLATFVSGYPKARTNWRWSLGPGYSNAAEELFDQGYVNLEGPSCFGARVFKRTLAVTNHARWWSFLFEQDVRAGLLAGIHSLASILRSSSIIYLPDSAYPPSSAWDVLHEGGGVGEVAAWLETNVGAAAPSIDAIRGDDEDHWDESGYVIERIEAAA